MPANLQKSWLADLETWPNHSTYVQKSGKNQLSSFFLQKKKIGITHRFYLWIYTFSQRYDVFGFFFGTLFRMAGSNLGSEVREGGGIFKICILGFLGSIKPTDRFRLRIMGTWGLAALDKSLHTVQIWGYSSYYLDQNMYLGVFVLAKS